MADQAGPVRPLVVGSVQTNLGHLEAAAGITGLLKVVMAIGHRELPATLHFSTPSLQTALGELGLRVQDQLSPWPDAAARLAAGVSAFGMGGTNCHVVGGSKSYWPGTAGWRPGVSAGRSPGPGQTSVPAPW